MTLYTYVPGKAELLDLMLDAAYQRMARTDTTGQPWRQPTVGTAAGSAHRAAYDPHHAYDFGLQTIRDGLAALIGPRASPRHRPRAG